MASRSKRTAGTPAAEGARRPERSYLVVRRAVEDWTVCLIFPEGGRLDGTVHARHHCRHTAFRLGRDLAARYGVPFMVEARR